MLKNITVYGLPSDYYTMLETQKEMKRAVQWQNYLQSLTGKYIPLNEALTFATRFRSKTTGRNVKGS